MLTKDMCNPYCRVHNVDKKIRVVHIVRTIPDTILIYPIEILWIVYYLVVGVKYYFQVCQVDGLLRQVTQRLRCIDRVCRDKVAGIEGDVGCVEWEPRILLFTTTAIGRLSMQNHDASE